MNRTLRIALFAAAASAFAACSDAEDPFFTPDTSEQDTSTADAGGDVADDATVTDTDIPDATIPDVAIDVGGTDTSTDAAVDTGTPDTSEDTGPDVVASTCGDDVVFTGQVFASDDPAPDSPDGGAPRFEPWEASYDSGIAALLAEAPTGEDEDDAPVAGDWTITEATVIATDYNSDTTRRAQRSFWLGDGNGSINVFFPADATENHPEFSVKVGQRVSVNVTELGHYNGVPQISGATNWTLQSEDNQVYINDLTEGPVTSEMINSVVRVTGTLTSLENPDCGGSQCYTLTYNDGETMQFRSSSIYIEVGDCITFVGPVGGFYGTPQFNTNNFAWLWSYDN